MNTFEKCDMDQTMFVKQENEMVEGVFHFLFNTVKKN